MGFNFWKILGRMKNELSMKIFVMWSCMFFGSWLCMIVSSSMNFLGIFQVVGIEVAL